MRGIIYHLTENHFKNNGMVKEKKHPGKQRISSTNGLLRIRERKKERKRRQMLMNKAAGIAYFIKHTIGLCTPSQKKIIE
jgi:hypothetical protein